jgi:hypothetical protein
MQHRRYVNARKHSIPEHIVNPGYQTIVPGDKMPDGSGLHLDASRTQQ